MTSTLGVSTSHATMPKFSWFALGAPHPPHFSHAFHIAGRSFIAAKIRLV